MKTDVVKLIDQLKKEIIEADRTDDPFFRITGAEVEIAFTIEGETSTGFDLKLVKANAGVKESRVHRITVMLETVEGHPASYQSGDSLGGS